MVTPAERLDAAEAALAAFEFDPSDLNYVPLQALVAIGRLLQNIDNRQAASAPVEP